MLSSAMGNRFVRQFGERVRNLREDKDMSQEALADAAGLHRTHISLIERASGLPGWKRLNSWRSP